MASIIFENRLYLLFLKLSPLRQKSEFWYDPACFLHVGAIFIAKRIQHHFFFGLNTYDIKGDENE